MNSSLLFILLAAVLVAGNDVLPPGHPPVPAAGLDPNKIICPVLAAMVKAGDLVPDINGSCTLEQIRSGLRDVLMCNKHLANEQATGIADYDLENKETMDHRDRCFPTTECWKEKQLNGVTNLTERWLNIYKMEGLETVEHGVSTGVRGGASNVPDFDHTGGQCNGTYPCEQRFQDFYVPCADNNNRFYLSNVLCVVCNAQKYGDKSGEFAYNPLQPGRQWQMTAAISGWIFAFGRLDTTSEKSKLESEMDEEGNVRYLTMQDARDMMLEGKYPQDWKPRPWGKPQSLAIDAQRTLPCDVNEPWWEETDCPSWTGEYCIPLVTGCGGGAHCLDNGHCVCGKDDNLVSMCAKKGKDGKAGECYTRDDTCTYFGAPCSNTRKAADSPHAPF